jgi:Uma2 family endonuclease
MLIEELEMDMVAGGSTTYKRRDLDKGAEPDECYWLQDNARLLRGKSQLDLNVDPVPDLIIQVEVSGTILDRLEIFAALGVPEVWRWNGRTLESLHLQADGTYRSRVTSRNFPTLRVSAIARFLKEGQTASTMTWVRSFRAFVREHVIPRP